MRDGAKLDSSHYGGDRKAQHAEGQVADGPQSNEGSAVAAVSAAVSTCTRGGEGERGSGGEKREGGRGRGGERERGREGEGTRGSGGEKRKGGRGREEEEERGRGGKEGE